MKAPTGPNGERGGLLLHAFVNLHGLPLPPSTRLFVPACTSPFLALPCCRYPQALIVSVEASSRNFRMLRLNTQPYPNVVPVNVALWPRVAPLSLIVGPRNPDLPPEWGYMVRETSEVSGCLVPHRGQ